MSIDEQAESLTQRALLALEGVSSEGPQAVAQEIDTFLGRYRPQLSAWRIDELEGAFARLTGNVPGAPQAQQSATLAGLKTWVSDDTSAGVYWGNQAKETLSSIGSKVGEAVGAGADSALGKMLKSPSMIAVFLVAGVLGAAWVYRSFK